MEKSKIRTFHGYWTVGDVRRHPKALFVYGDNNIGQGKGGQAIIRDEPNTIGIPTKKYPSNHPSSFYTDDEYDDNIIRIRIAINEIIARSKNYGYVVLPADGFGTGLAQLPKKAPKTYNYLVRAINKMKKML